jgi:hypothetical protein
MTNASFASNAPAPGNFPASPAASTAAASGNIAASPAASTAATKASDHFPWDQLIPISPQLLGLLLLAAFLVILGRKRIMSMLRRIRKVGFAGFEVELASDLDSLAESKKSPMTNRQASRTARLLEDNREMLSCARLLWVDDLPRNNLREMKILRRLCVQIDLARSTAEAEQCLHRAVYDIVISDMYREGDPKSGEAMVFAIAESPIPPPLIYYVGEEREPPTGTFGLTTRPDELFQLIVHAMRSRKA